MEPDELYRFQVQNLTEYAMFVISPAGILGSWNAGVEQLFGYSEKEWIGKHASLIFTPPENADEIFEAELQKARQFGFSTDIRWHVKKDGNLFFANGYMNLLRDDAGEVIGYAKIVSDETERKRLEDSLTESNTALEQFAWVASHDLQEPLRTMGTFSELLREKYASAFDQDAHQYLSFIVSAAERMTALVKDLLSYAQNATEVDRPISVALDEDLETALSHLSGLIAESDGVVTHDSLPALNVDRGRMVRLFQNLIGNALKYRKQDEPPRVHVTADLRGTEWVFSVRDNGIGFEPRFAGEIFAPFKRLHSGRDYTGTGVGLAICSRIVAAHGGRIWAESQPGVGSTFFFSLPANA